MKTHHLAYPLARTTAGLPFLIVACLLSSCAPAEKPELTVHNAASTGDAVTLKRILEKNPGLVNHRNPDRNARQRTPLHEAATREVADILIQAGADIRAGDHFNWTPLHTARNAEVAQLLISKGADIHAKAQRQFTPLYTVEDPGAAETLIRSGADVNAPASGHLVPIIWHIENCRPDIVAVLIRNGADLHPERRDKKTLLHFAADRDKAESVQLLIQRGLDVNARDQLGATPLHYAAFKGYVPVAAALLEHGADPNVRLSQQAGVMTFTGGGRPREKSIAGCTALDIADGEEMKALLAKHDAQPASALPAAEPAPVRASRPVLSSRPTPTTRSSTRHAPAPRPAPSAGTPASFIGSSLSDVRSRLGNPKMQYKQGDTLILIYPGREISSRDGITVHSDRLTSR